MEPTNDQNHQLKHTEIEIWFSKLTCIFTGWIVYLMTVTRELDAKVNGTKLMQLIDCYIWWVLMPWICQLLNCGHTWSGPFIIYSSFFYTYYQSSCATFRTGIGMIPASVHHIDATTARPTAAKQRISSTAGQTRVSFSLSLSSLISLCVHASHQSYYTYIQ